MEWYPLILEHKALIDQALEENPLNLSDYTFTNLWIWNIHRHYQIAWIDNFLCIKFAEKGLTIFLYPIGSGSRQYVSEKLMEVEANFRMRAVPEEGIAELNELPLKVEAETEHFDYIYAFTDLLYLQGDHFQPKRNFIHQFEKKYLFEYQEIALDLIPLIIDFEKKWYSEHKNPPQSLCMEHSGVLHALNDFTKLNIFGGVLIVDKKVVAYSFAEYLNKQMLVIHIEKALKDYKGAYAMIHQQLLMHSTIVPFVNREEDLNLDNLIKVKQSYHPIRFEKKFLLTKNSEP
ncbi:MAG: DUF2156 domain-containing protein [Parachlamydiaceae bacterium]|nr:DUF2156 domain-containing protein [Parachlamydiaceae bacterium]